MKPKRILILMSRTGGGHLASANALKTVFGELYGDAFQVEIVDLLIDHLPWPLRELPKSYPFLAGKAPWLWNAIFQTGPGLSAALGKFTAVWSRDHVVELFTQAAPDLIISVHPLAQEFTVEALEAMGAKIPFVIVVTDLATGHHVWFHPAAQLAFVASQAAWDTALARGLTAEQLRLYGLPVRPEFAQPPRPRPTLRAELEMHPDLPAALLVGGGEGIGRVAEIAQALAGALAEGDTPTGQMAVICGSNQKLYAELDSVAWPVPTRVLGFVNNMPDWMAACDCIVTKAGPGTIAEALIRGLPIVLSGYIPGQEEGNVPYVVENGVGAYSEEPAEIARIVCAWFGPQAEARQRMADQAKQIAHPRSTYLIVEEIAGRLLGKDEGGRMKDED